MENATNLQRMCIPKRLHIRTRTMHLYNQRNNNTKENGETTMLKFNKTEIEKGRNAVRRQLRKNNKLPSVVTIKSTDGKTRNLTRRQFAGLCENDNVYRVRYGKVPNYVTLASEASNPLVLEYQYNEYNCGPTSVSMATQMLYGFRTQKACAKLLGTNEYGTSPSQLVNNIGKLGYKATRIKRNFAAVKASLDKNRPVIMHIQTKPATCLGYIGSYGHYILCWKAADNKYYICDPTKGDKVCNHNIIDAATEGRDIGYYSISLL